MRKGLHAVKIAVVAAAMAVGAGAVHACDSDPTSADAPDAAPNPWLDAHFERAVFEPVDGPYPSPFEGWDLLGEYDPACGLFVPKSKEYLPEPFRWEPCLQYPETAGLSCRQMVLDWPPQKANPELISPGTRAFQRSTGALVLQTARYRADDTYRLIAELDGPVLISVREHDVDHCVINEEPSDGEFYAYRVFDSEVKGEASDYGGGAIGGRLDELRPKVLKHYHDTATRSFIAGAPGLLEVSGGTLSLSRWSDGWFVKNIWSSAQDGLQQNYPFFHDDVLFWAADTLAINKQKVFTEAGGAKDFLSYGDDASKGIADLGTDGTHLAWIEGYGRTKTSDPFPQVSAFVAPYSTDPATVQSTRKLLRSDLTGSPFGTSPFIVGCGYAARFTSYPTVNDLGTMLIRLSDGYMWMFRQTTAAADWNWSRPLAITCDEIILRVGQHPTPGAPMRGNIARVRLDSLGPGTPP